MKVLSLVNYLPTEINPDENDITLKIYAQLSSTKGFGFHVMKALNLSPLFVRLVSTRFRLYHRLKHQGSTVNKKYDVRISFYEFPDFKEPIKLKVKLTPFYFRLFFGKVARSLRLDTFEIIHSNAIYPDLLIGDILSRQYNIPHKSTLRGNPRTVKENLEVLRPMFERTELSTPNFEIFECLLKEGIDVSYIPHGIEKLFFNEPLTLDDNSGVVNFITVSRLLKLKNIDESIKLVSHLKSSGLKVRYHIIGGGEEEATLKKLTSSMGLSNEVVFYGRRDQEFIIEMYKKCEFFLLFSDRETFGLAYLEAMANGCIIISKPLVGITAYFKDAQFVLKHTGLEETRKMILEILEDKVEFDLRKASYRASLEFTSEKMYKRYADFLTK